MTSNIVNGQKRVEKIGVACSETDKAQAVFQQIDTHYTLSPLGEADAIIVLGGDGFMLRCLHEYGCLDVPMYGMNCGSTGFLMNACKIDHLYDRLARAESQIIHPLMMRAWSCGEEKLHEARAFNEVSLLRQTRQSAKIQIAIDGKIRLPELIADGVLLSTAVGSTAYNMSLHGPILPIESNMLALMPISGFRPRRWNGALLPARSQLRFAILEHEKRPVSAVADHTEIRDVVAVEVLEDRDCSVCLLFDEGRNLSERILGEQFFSPE